MLIDFVVKIYKIVEGKEVLVTEDTFKANDIEAFHEEFEDVSYNREDEVEEAFNG